MKKLDNELGEFFSNSLMNFINHNKISADLISSHGHTVFHDIKLQLTVAALILGDNSSAKNNKRDKG